MGRKVNFAVAEYSIAVLAVQSPLRHCGNFLARAGLDVINDGNNLDNKNVQI